MPSLNLDLDLEQHPKMRRLIRAVGDDAMLYVIRLWVYCGKYHLNGRLDGYTDQEIHKAVAWTRLDINLTDQLRLCGFIRQGKSGPYIHDWKDHAGHLIAFKLRSQAANKARWEKYAPSTPTRSPSKSPPPNPTIPTKQSYPDIPNKRVVPTRLGDRSETGFTRLNVDEVVKSAQTWPKEIP